MCDYMCQGALQGFSGTLRVSLNSSWSHLLPVLLACGLGENILVHFYFQIPISLLYLSSFQHFYQTDSHKHS